MSKDSTNRKVVIVGGGFGGLLAAQGLNKQPVEVTLIDRRNFHLFQPLLYQVATGGLSPANIAAPLRSVLKKQRNIRVVLGEVTGFDVERHLVKLNDGSAVPFDMLILATGSSHHYFGNDHWAKLAPGIKASRMQQKFVAAFSQHSSGPNEKPTPTVRARLLTFVVVGGGADRSGNGGSDPGTRALHDAL